MNAQYEVQLIHLTHKESPNILGHFYLGEKNKTVRYQKARQMLGIKRANHPIWKDRVFYRKTNKGWKLIAQ